MTTQLEQLLVRIDATTEGLRRELKNSEGAIQNTASVIDKFCGKIETRFADMGIEISKGLLTSLGILGAGEIFSKFIENTNEAQAALSQLQAVIASTGGKAGITVDAAEKLAQSFANVSIFSKDAIVNSEALLLQYTKIGGDIFPKAEQAVLDFATRMKIDLPAATKIVGKALNDPIAGLTALGKAGVQVTQAQKDLAKSMVESGNLIGAQGLLFEIITGKVGGAAKAMRDTLPGALDALKNSFAELFEFSKEDSQGLIDVIDEINKELPTIVRVAGAAAIGYMATFVPAIVAGTTAMIAGVGEMILYEAALAEMAGVSKIAAVAMLGLDAALGPVGIALGIAGAAYFLISHRTEQAATSTDQLWKADMDLLAAKQALEGPLTTSAEKLREETQAKIDATEKTIKLAEAEILLLEAKAKEGEPSAWDQAKMGAAPVSAINNSIKQKDEIIKQLKSDLADLGKSLDDFNEEHPPGAPDDGRDLTNLAANQAKYRAELELTLVQEKALIEANLESGGAHTALKQAIDAENEARKEGFKVGTDEFEQVKAEIIQKEKLKATDDALTKTHEEALKKLQEADKKAAEVTAQAFEHAFENIQDEFAKMLENGKFSFQDLVTAAKKSAAQIASALIFRPIFAQAGASVLNSFGATDAAAKLSAQGGSLNILQSLGLPSAQAFGNISSFGDIGQMLASGPNVAGGFGVINTFGANNLGTGLPGLEGSLTGASLSGILAGGGLGSAGASMVGLGNKNPLINGAAGLAGAALTAALIPELGPFAPIVGGFAGSALSGLFGGGKHNLASNATSTGFDSTGTLTGVNLRSDNTTTEQAQGLVTAVNQLTQQLVQITGVNPQGIKDFSAGVTNGNGTFSFGSAPGDTISFNANDQADMQRALGDLAKLFITKTEDISGGVSATMTTALAHITTAGRSVTDVLNDIAFAASYDSLGQMPVTLSDTQKAVMTLKTQFADYADTAERLGLAVDKVNQAETQRLNEMLSGYSQTMSQTILNILDPIAEQQIQENQRYAQQLVDLKNLGATQKDIDTANLLHQAEMAAILNSNNATQSDGLQKLQDQVTAANALVSRYANISTSFGDLIYQLQYGQYAPTTPVQNLSDLRDMVTTLGAQAANGDPDAAEQLAQILPDFVQLSAQVNGYNQQYEQDRQLALSLSKQAQNTADRQVELQTEIADAAQTQITVLQTGFGALQASIDALGDKLSTQDIINSAAGVSSNELRPGESANSILGLVNPNNNLPETLVRQIKSSLGFDFSSPANTGVSFAQWVNAGHQAAGAQFNQLIAAAGGKTQVFAEGGPAFGMGGIDKIPAMISNGEFVMKRNSVSRIGMANLQRMNSGGGYSDNAGVEMRLDNMIKITGSLANIMAAGGNMTAAQLESLNTSMGVIARNARFAAATQ